MLKIKLFGTYTNCSELKNPEKLYDFFPNLKKQRVTAENPNFGSGIEFELLNVELNRVPFYDFFTIEEKGNPKFVERINENKKEDSDVTPLDITPLNMYNPNTGYFIKPLFDINWTIQKELTVSDCTAQHRLLIGKKQAEDHIMSRLNESSQADVKTLDGCRVNVFDCDIGIELKLTLKKWPTTNYYGLMDNWKRDFVNRRGLIPGDEIGLCWDNNCDRLLFSVLKKWYD